jgi:hypothetical protein
MTKTEKTQHGTQKTQHGTHHNTNHNVGRHAAERARPEHGHAEHGRAEHDRDERRTEEQVRELRDEGARATREAMSGARETLQGGRAAVEQMNAGFDGLSRDLMSNAGRLFDQSSRTMQEMWQARTIQDVMRLQLDFASALMDAQLRYVEAMTRAASQIAPSSGGNLQRMFAGGGNPGQRDVGRTS